MAGFLKVLFRNLLDGPSTDPYPLGETFTPDRVRGKVKIDPELCVGCGICKRVCAAGAIDITPKEDKSGYTITVWRNSCCLCAACRHYCPVKAISVTNDWHTAQPESEKYTFLEQHEINYVPCAHCGTLMRPLSLKQSEKLYAENKEVDPAKIRLLCPKCRQIEDAKFIEKIEPVEDELALESAPEAQAINITKEENLPVPEPVKKDEAMDKAEVTS